MTASFLTISTLLGAACATSDTEVDELAGDESVADDAATGKADGAVDGSYTYFEIYRDMRRCASPMCGGFFVSRLNRTTTVCEDGTSKSACYAPVLDWSEANLSEAQQAKLLDMAGKDATTAGVWSIVRGRFAHTNDTPRPDLGKFMVTEAWVAEGQGVSDGVFARIKDAGIRCITTPCASTIEKALNKSASAMIAGLDFEPSGLSDRQLEGFYQSMVEPSGFIVSGDRYTVRENGHSAKGRTVTQAYHRLADPTTNTCFVGGCSGQVCSDHEGVITTCEWRDEYACYQTAACERQTDGSCGWTNTPELATCLGN